jgi:hypothetical protein
MKLVKALVVVSFTVVAFCSTSQAETGWGGLQNGGQSLSNGQEQIGGVGNTENVVNIGNQSGNGMVGGGAMMPGFGGIGFGRPFLPGVGFGGIGGVGGIGGIGGVGGIGGIGGVGGIGGIGGVGGIGGFGRFGVGGFGGFGLGGLGFGGGFGVGGFGFPGWGFGFPFFPRAFTQGSTVTTVSNWSSLLPVRSRSASPVLAGVRATARSNSPVLAGARASTQSAKAVHVTPKKYSGIAIAGYKPRMNLQPVHAQSSSKQQVQRQVPSTKVTQSKSTNKSSTSNSRRKAGY